MEAKTGEALDAMAEESICEKIRALISRNDFTTAEKLLEKHSASFAESEEDELRALIAEKRRENQRNARKRERRLRLGRRWNSHWRTVLPLERALARCVLAGMILFVPYLKNKFYAWPEPFEILGMEIFLLVYLLAAALLCGLALMDAHTRKLSSREAKRRTEKAGGELMFQTFQRMEKRGAKEERGWLAALLCVTLWILIQIGHIFF